MDPAILVAIAALVIAVPGIIIGLGQLFHAMRQTKATEGTNGDITQLVTEVRTALTRMSEEMARWRADTLAMNRNYEEDNFRQMESHRAEYLELRGAMQNLTHVITEALIKWRP